MVVAGHDGTKDHVKRMLALAQVGEGEGGKGKGNDGTKDQEGSRRMP